MSVLFSVITPVYEPPLDALREAIESVRQQTCPDWELILVDDCSPSAAVRDVLRSYAKLDSRIKVIERQENGHIVATSNDAIAAANGEFVALLDHDDLLTPDALTVVKKEIETNPEVDYLYSDEDKVTEDSVFYGEFTKPDWSPERLRGQMYCGHLSVIRAELLNSVGGFREGFDGSQDHDLILRVTEKARAVVHIPRVLYHWRAVTGSTAGDTTAKPYASIAGQKAVQSQLDRLGIPGEVKLSRAPHTYIIERRLDPSVRVSIVIPTNGKSGVIWGDRRCFVVEAVRSALARTVHENLEIIVVYDTNTPPPVLTELQRIAGDKLRLVPYTDEWNFSRKCNVGFFASSGSRIVLLNDDVEVRSDNWLEQLVAPLDEPDVGMTGAKLYYSDGTIQHGGHRYTDGHFHHAFIYQDGTSEGWYRSLLINRECTGLTAAAAALRREVYDQIGGLSEALPANFNDVDLSYKVRKFGYRNVWIANCELYHFESRTRVRAIDAWEAELVWSRWGHPDRDPYLPACEQ